MRLLLWSTCGIARLCHKQGVCGSADNLNGCCACLNTFCALCFPVAIGAYCMFQPTALHPYESSIAMQQAGWLSNPLCALVVAICLCVCLCCAALCMLACGKAHKQGSEQQGMLGSFLHMQHGSEWSLPRVSAYWCWYGMLFVPTCGYWSVVRPLLTRTWLLLAVCHPVAGVAAACQLETRRAG
jgi:hypothetical protein